MHWMHQKKTKTLNASKEDKNRLEMKMKKASGVVERRQETTDIALILLFSDRQTGQFWLTRCTHSDLNLAIDTKTEAKE